MATASKFQQAFDTLLKDFNDKVEEVKSNIQHLSADVKVQVDGQKENLQEYGEKIKGRINQIVDVDKVRANVLAEAENVVDDAKGRIEKLFQFINEQVNLGEKKAKKAASDFSKQAEKFSNEIEKDVKKASKDLQKNVKQATTKAEKNIKKVEKDIETKVAKVTKDVKATATKVTKDVKAKTETVKKDVKTAVAKTTAPAKKAAAKKAPAKKAAATPTKKKASK
jgi:archaellum component FlaC